MDLRDALRTGTFTRQKAPRTHETARKAVWWAYTHAADVLRKVPPVMAVAKKIPVVPALAKRVSKRVLVPNVGGERALEILRSVADTSRVRPPAGELTMADVYNPALARAAAEHEILLQDNKIYYYAEPSPAHYSRRQGDPRLVALYLPQFHPFKENDEAWGKGFTEWSNVAASTPRFVGQQQPVLPADLGFYDLRLPDVMDAQIALAKKYGVFGFQFYYYWFSGKKLMDTPINTFLDHKEWDFHFSICWANENWTRKWDGSESDVIIEQENLPSDPLDFIKDVAPILCDERYITEHGKPILTVYRVDLLDDPVRYAQVWRDYMREHHGKELWLIGCTTFANFDPQSVGFDAAMDLTPPNSVNPDIKPYVWDDARKCVTVPNDRLLDRNWIGEVFDMRYIAQEEIAHLADNPNDYLTISPSWCNEARRKGDRGATFFNGSPELFAYWLDKILAFETGVKHNASPLVFLNAWNEWAESAMLEPSTHLGHSSLRRVAEVVSRYSKNQKNRDGFPAFGLRYSTDAKLAVVVHLFYPDMWPIFAEKLAHIDVPFDVYVTVMKRDSDIEIAPVGPNHRNTNVIVVANRGRDVLPFLVVATRLRELRNYDYVLKLHSKKTEHRSDGSQWLAELLDDLLPADVTKIMQTLDDPMTGCVGPGRHLVSLQRHLGSDEADMRALMARMCGNDVVEKVFGSLAKYPYFGGTMFWARMDYLDPLLDQFLTPGDFPPEEGQIDGTMAHAIERILGRVLHKIEGRTMYAVINGKVAVVRD